MAVTASAGLSLTACTGPSSSGDGVDLAAVEAPAAEDGTEPTQQQAAEQLVVRVDDVDPASSATSGTATSTTSESTTSAPTTASSQPASTATTAASTTTTTAAVTVASTTTAPAAAVETRPEILRLALPTYGGGTFDPDSVAGRNIVLWFWGAH